MNHHHLERSVLDHAILVNAYDPIITIDHEGTVVSASNSVKRVLGWEPKELIDRNVNVLMPEPHHAAHDSYLARYHRTGEATILDRPRRLEALHKDGTRIPIELCVSRAEMPDGAPALFVGIMRDMSDQAEAEQSRDRERVQTRQQIAEQTSSLEEAHLRLRMTDRMASIGTLAAGIGHDLTNVLMPLRGFLNALRASAKEGHLRECDEKHLDDALKSLAYLSQLADGLHFLALDPAAEGDGRGAASTTNLSEWWSQTGALLTKAVPKHVEVTTSIPNDLPSVAVSSHGLTQAVLNLIVNAGESIPEPSSTSSSVQGTVHIKAIAEHDLEPDSVRLSVEDNGRGMSEDVQRQAFDLFFTTKPRGLGTGLGLTLVRNVVEQVGGSVEIISEVGKGTTVTLVMPTPSTGSHHHGAPVRPRAAISIGDGRALSLMQHLLESSGIPVRYEVDPYQAEIWVVDPSIVHAEEVEAWRKRRPASRLVLFGEPKPETTHVWQPLDPITIKDPDSLERVREALEQASELS